MPKSFSLEPKKQGTVRPANFPCRARLRRAFHRAGFGSRLPPARSSAYRFLQASHPQPGQVRPVKRTPPPLPLRENVPEITLVLFPRDVRLVQPETLVDGLLGLAARVEIEEGAVRHQLHVGVDAARPGASGLLEVRLLLLVRIPGHRAPARAQDHAGLAGDPLLGAVVEEGLERFGPRRIGAGVVAVEGKDRLAAPRLTGEGPAQGGRRHRAQEPAPTEAPRWMRHGITLPASNFTPPVPAEMA